MSAPPGPPTVRPAVPSDLAAVTAIYDEQVATSVATFDLESPPASTWTAKLAAHEPGDHFLVAVGDDEQVEGFAYSGAYRPRPGYRHTREVSVYLAPAARGRGVGRALYRDLLARVDADGVRTTIAVVAQPNPASDALHRACGFAPAGLLPQVGRKFDRWIDVALYTRARPEALR